MDEKFDLLLKGIDSIKNDVAECTKRMDGVEEREKARKDATEEEERKKADAAKRKDGEEDPEAEKARELAADKARKDAEEKAEEEKKRADAAVAASADLLKRIDSQSEEIKALAARIPKSAADADYGDMVKMQVRADDIYVKLGERARAPMLSEDKDAYERSLVAGLQKHSERWAGIDLSGIPQDAFPGIRDQIYADAATASRRPTGLAAGTIIPRTRQTGTGHTITEFFGNDASFTRKFSRPPRRVVGFARPKD
jgi:hypothetical protein